MPSTHGAGYVKKAVVLMTVSIGCSSAARLLLQDAIPCDDFVANKDYFGNDLGDPIDTASQGDCLDLCKAEAACNGFTRLNGGNGRCFLKSIPDGAVIKDSTPNRVTYKFCPADDPPVDDPPADDPPADDPSPAGGTTFDNLLCNTLLTDTDLPGGATISRLADPGSDQACVDVCLTTDGCNAAVRIGDGRCFLKTLAVDAESVDKTGTTSYAVCSVGGGTPPPPADDPPADDPPADDPPSAGGTTFDNLDCDTFLADTDLPGGTTVARLADPGSDQDCVDECTSTAGCNAAVRIGDGRCFLKTLGANDVSTDKSGTTSYAVCGGGGNPPPADDPPADDPPADDPPPANFFDNLECNTFLGDTDLDGGNTLSRIKAPISDQACVDACATTAGCNAAIKLKDGRCFLKTLAADAVATSKTDFTSYAVC